jgi:hypothetical protein
VLRELPDPVEHWWFSGHSANVCFTHHMVADPITARPSLPERSRIVPYVGSKAPGKRLTRMAEMRNHHWLILSINTSGVR